MHYAEDIKKNVSFYFQNKTSFLVTEIMTLYLKTNDEKIQIKCLELLNEIPA